MKEKPKENVNENENDDEDKDKIEMRTPKVAVKTPNTVHLPPSTNLLLSSSFTSRSPERSDQTSSVAPSLQQPTSSPPSKPAHPPQSQASTRPCNPLGRDGSSIGKSSRRWRGRASSCGSSRRERTTTASCFKLCWLTWFIASRR